MGAGLHERPNSIDERPQINQAGTPHPSALESPGPCLCGRRAPWNQKMCPGTQRNAKGQINLHTVVVPPSVTTAPAAPGHALAVSDTHEVAAGSVAAAHALRPLQRLAFDPHAAPRARQHASARTHSTPSRIQTPTTDARCSTNTTAGERGPSGGGRWGRCCGVGFLGDSILKVWARRFAWPLAPQPGDARGKQNIVRRKNEQAKKRKKRRAPTSIFKFGGTHRVSIIDHRRIIDAIMH